MNVMKINLTMNEDKSIIVKNISSEKFLKINFDNKTITATDVYEVLSYIPNTIYKIESNIDDIIDGNDKTYFSDIINLMNSIITEINEMADSQNNVSNNDNSNLDGEKVLEVVGE